MAAPEALVSALADPARLLLFARICAAPEGLPHDEVPAKLVRRLADAGLVTLGQDRCRAAPEVFRDALAKAPADPLDALFRRGRLVTIPHSGKRRQLLLAYLAERFEPGRLYTEREVREKLVMVHDDHATLRRYLVDEGLLQRSNDGGAYGRPSEARVAG
ncbi:DUF2087 domain-containing protein [Amycolatopsis australiensis]|uniref:DUF2087 domain-containing protein n=1 Tax=Amycolatopsis australiensis TaxID=546364 RepID=A0A1K1SKA1_9PSEU|nr:DUF2087 domain-containing protein [Amycolatopsis australiensis]SFW84714.1 hypothetical protein SAMN04489730_5937 [Amycolatopsis australiensis]